MSSTLERIEEIEKSLKALSEQLNQARAGANSGTSTEVRQLVELVNSRSLSLEVSLTELAKTVTALAAELTANNVLSSKNVLDRIIKMNEEEDQKEVDNLLEQGILVNSDQVKPHSFVVAAHSVVDLTTPAESKVVMERRLLRLPTALVNNELKSDLVGRKQGDQIQINKDQDGKVHVLTVKEIYDLNEKELVRHGEGQLNV